MSTSRIARKPVPIPSGVDIKRDNQSITVKGPKGQLKVEVHPFVKVAIDKESISVSSDNELMKTITSSERKLFYAIAGTVRSNLNNTIAGVTKGFERKLVLVGVGYRAQSKGKVLALSLGFSHPTEFSVPEGITIETPTPTEIIVKGINKQLVGLVASQIRSVRSPEPYKGKGVRYLNEIIELKETKKK